jgi:tetratricopeptide (TPR) repeat protein
MDYNSLIDSYLDGELTGSELNDFLKEVERNPALAREVKLHKRVNKFLVDKAEEEDLREHLNDIHKAYLDSGAIDRSNTSSTDKRSKRIYFLIAAGILLLFGVYFISKLCQPSNKKIYAEYFQPFKITAVTRGGRGDDSITLMKNAKAKYENSKYDEAAVLFKKVLQVDSADPEAYFLLGICYMEMDSMNAASILFQNKVLLESIYNADAGWYLGLCYVKMNEISKAVEQFQKIKVYGDYYSKKSEVILKELGQ